MCNILAGISVTFGELCRWVPQYCRFLLPNYSSNIDKNAIVNLLWQLQHSSGFSGMRSLKPCTNTMEKINVLPCKARFKFRFGPELTHGPISRGLSQFHVCSGFSYESHTISYIAVYQTYFHRRYSGKRFRLRTVHLSSQKYPSSGQNKIPLWCKNSM